jgi:hypothetical protein
MKRTTKSWRHLTRYSSARHPLSLSPPYFCVFYIALQPPRGCKGCCCCQWYSMSAWLEEKEVAFSFGGWKEGRKIARDSLQIALFFPLVAAASSSSFSPPLWKENVACFSSRNRNESYTAHPSTQLGQAEKQAGTS